MLTSIVLAKIAGAVLLAGTLRSIYKHFLGKKAKSESKPKDSVNDPKQAVSEQILNNLLLYLWLAFMLAFSTGMIVNN